MAQRRGDDWDDDDWGVGGGGRGGTRGAAKPDYNIVLNAAPSYGHNNYNDSTYFQQPPAYDDLHQQPPGRIPVATPNMDHMREKYSSPWYRKKRILAALALVVIIVIVVPVAVVVSRNKERANAYPDYSTLNYTLSETCERGPAASNPEQSKR